MTNREIAQEISNRIGTAPVPFDSVYSIALEIYHQLGGEESQFDSVYSILLEILPLVEGGGSGKAIEIVDALPEASENKEKFYRLSSDDDVYVSELKSRTSITTNRLPDAQQIDKAYLYDGDAFYYKGAWKYVFNDGELDGYGWLSMYAEDEWRFYLTQDNAVNVESSTKGCFVSFDEVESVDLENHTITINEPIIDWSWDEAGTLSENDIFPIHATYNAPESAQIGNAYIYSDAQGGNYEYIGTEVEVSYQGTTISGYKWGNSNTDFLVSTKKASEIYFLLDSDMGGSAYYDFELYSSVDGDVVSDRTSDIYIPQLNAPDSEQVDNAYLEMETHNKGNGKFYYKGEIQIREYDYETVSSDYVIGHLWETEDKYHRYITLTNAQNIYSGNIGGHFEDEDLQYYGDEIGWASTTYTLAEIPSLISYYDTGYIISQVPSTVKYQRTETIEEWDWKKVAVKEDIKPAIIDVESLPDEATDDNKGNIYRMEGDSNYAATYAYGILPDDEQIDEAYFDANLDSYNNFYYKGAFKVICSDGEYEGYAWYGESESFNFLLLTESNAVDITDSDTYYNFNTEEMTLTIDWDTNTATVDVTTEDIHNGTLSDIDEFGSITKAEGNVLQWSAIATEGYVDDAIADIDFPEYTAGSNISISDDREISCTYQYSLPTASNSALGGVKVGSGLSIDNNGVLSSEVQDEEINVRIRVEENPELKNYLTFEAAENNCEIQFKAYNSAIGTPIIEYSTDGIVWNSYTTTGSFVSVITLNSGDKLYLRRDGADLGQYKILRINVTANCYIYGNVASLFSKTNFEYIYKMPFSLQNLFESNTKILSHPDKKLYLPFTELVDNAYNAMFKGCTNLTESPELPAKVAKSNCYKDMFNGCTNLVKAPSKLFENATSFACQYMFNGCSSLTTAPELPALTLYNRTYDGMFKGCTSLNYVKCLATNISATSCTNSWLNDVASNGTFIKNGNMSSWTTGTSGIPTGWTTQNDSIEYIEDTTVTQEQLETKANKVDYVVQLNPMTQQYDWTSLNSVTETGVYRISIEVDMMGTVMKMGAGDLFVQNTGTALVQTILLPSDDSIASHVRTSSNGGTSWTDSDVIVPSINDSATTSLTETYSIDKINSLISALDSRLTAIGG